MKYRLLSSFAAMALIAQPALAVTRTQVDLTSQAAGVLQAAQEPAHTGDCANTAGALTLLCTKTNGVAFSVLATTTPGAGVAYALGSALTGSGALVGAISPTLTGNLTVNNGGLIQNSSSSYGPQYQANNTSADGTAGYLNFTKARGAAAVQVGDSLGTFVFSGQPTGGGWGQAAYVSAYASAVGSTTVDGGLTYTLNGSTGKHTFVINSAVAGTIGPAGATFPALNLSQGSLAISNILGTSLYSTGPSRAALGWEEALGTSASPVTSFGPNVKLSRTESFTSASGCSGNNNNADCNGTLAVYSWANAPSLMQNTAIMANATGLQQTGPYNDSVAATFYGATYPSGNTATVTFAASGSTVSTLPAASYPVGTTIVFTTTGTLPTGILAWTPYQILTNASGVVTFGALNPSGPSTPPQTTWTGAGTGTMTATQGTADNKATALYTSAKTYSPDGKAVTQEVNTINLSGIDAPRNVNDGNGFFGLLVSCGGGAVTQWRCGNAIQITSDGSTWNSGVVVTGGGVYYSDFDAEATSTIGLNIGGNHTYQISGANWNVNGVGNLSIAVPSGNPAYLATTGAHDAYIQVDNQAGGNQSLIAFLDAGTTKWVMGKNAAQQFMLWDMASNKQYFRINPNGPLFLGEVQNFQIDGSTGATSIGYAGTQTSTMLYVLQAGSSEAYFGSTGANNSIVTIDDQAGGAQSGLFLNDAGTNKWQLVKTAGNGFSLWDNAASRNVFTVASGGAFTHLASTAAAASLNIPQGTAPTSPNNGDIWMTSAGLYYRFNGTTHGPL